MSDEMNRLWWPFEVVAEEQQTEQHKAEFDFLVKATDLGFRGYAEGSDLGAVAGDGRKCHIVWRGNHRRELLLIDAGGGIQKKIFVNSKDGAAFREAAEAGIAFLEKHALAPEKALKSFHS